jgi:hypothetical protein
VDSGFPHEATTWTSPSGFSILVVHLRMFNGKQTKFRKCLLITNTSLTSNSCKNEGQSDILEMFVDFDHALTGGAIHVSH